VKTSRSVAAAWTGALAAFVLGPTIEIAARLGIVAV